MAQTKGHMDSVKAYNKDKYARLYPFVLKERKPEIEAAAKAAGESLNEFINKAIDDRIKKLKGK